MALTTKDVAIGFSFDPTIAEKIADKNFELATKRDPSILDQEVKFDAWPFKLKDGSWKYGAKYYYQVEDAQETVTNHPQLNEGKARKGKAKVA